MSVIDKIAFFQDRRDDQPNKELARQLVSDQDRDGVAEIVAHLEDRNPNVQSDCIKVLYEVGYLDPALIAGYSRNFLALLRSRNNRLVWGGMIALSTIAPLAADELFPQREVIYMSIEKGSVITVDAGVKTLAGIAAQGDEYRQALMPYLLRHLETCRPKEVPQHAEMALVAVDAANRQAFIAVLQQRMPDMRPAQVARLKRVIRQAEGLV